MSLSYGLSLNRENTMTLLNVVLAVANDTPYALASLRSVGSVLGMETETRMRYYVFFNSF